LKLKLKILLLTSLFFVINGYAASEIQSDTATSLAFKKNRPSKSHPIFYQPDLSYQIWQQFSLLREANNGDALAQHELGIRYLLGEGFPADTSTGAYWIQKAALQNLTPACYNYGILLLNGWGVAWNPFEAYQYFLKAANDKMPAAQYIIGILHTDNLIVKKDLNQAYLWLQKSYANGYETASEVIKQLEGKVKINPADTIKYAFEDDPNKEFSGSDNPISSTLGLVYIDFEAIADSTIKISEEILLDDLFRLGSDTLAISLGVQKELASLNGIDFQGISFLAKSSEYGNPEALTLIGYLYQKGIYYPLNEITAAANYIRAIRLDAPRAPLLLWEIINSKSFYDNLRKESAAENPEALFVWYGLISYGFDNRVTESDAFELLNKAAALGHTPSIIELGLNYYTGKLVNVNKEKAREIWKYAERLNIAESKIRLSAVTILDGKVDSNVQPLIAALREAEKVGSILAQVTLAYCFENGIGVEENKAEAVKYYRTAAQRGSRFAYEELKRIYDQIRPAEIRFKVH
jgi:TPR repeat protein